MAKSFLLLLLFCSSANTVKGLTTGSAHKGIVHRMPKVVKETIANVISYHAMDYARHSNASAFLDKVVSEIPYAMVPIILEEEKVQEELAAFRPEEEETEEELYSAEPDTDEPENIYVLNMNNLTEFDEKMAAERAGSLVKAIVSNLGERDVRDELSFMVADRLLNANFDQNSSHVMQDAASVTLACANWILKDLSQFEVAQQKLFKEFQRVAKEGFRKPRPAPYIFSLPRTVEMHLADSILKALKARKFETVADVDASFTDDVTKEFRDFISKSIVNEPELLDSAVEHGVANMSTRKDVISSTSKFLEEMATLLEASWKTRGTKTMIRSPYLMSKSVMGTGLGIPANVASAETLDQLVDKACEAISVDLRTSSVSDDIAEAVVKGMFSGDTGHRKKKHLKKAQPGDVWRKLGFSFPNHDN